MISVTRLTAILCFVPVVVSADASPENFTQEKFLVCPRGYVYESQQSQVVAGRSRVACAAKCMRNENCDGVNVCPTDLPNLVSCELIEDSPSEKCGNLSAAGHPSCFYMQPSDADEESTSPIECENGGTVSGSRCLCPIQYSGTTCERLVRDCQEIFENGYQVSGFNGLYDIEPKDAVSPFKVLCKFDSGAGVTMIMQRNTTSTSLFNQNWATMKAGINLPISSDSDEFFIGLENLHQLVLQAEYQLVVDTKWSFGSGSAFYDNLVIGDESTKYELSYDNFNASGNNPPDNGFPTDSGPIKFVTSDVDFLCTMSSGGAGWFITGCTSMGRIFTSTMRWPSLGVTQQLDLAQLSLKRPGAILEA